MLVLILAADAKWKGLKCLLLQAEDRHSTTDTQDIRIGGKILDRGAEGALRGPVRQEHELSGSLRSFVLLDHTNGDSVSREYA